MHPAEGYAVAPGKAGLFNAQVPGIGVNTAFCVFLFHPFCCNIYIYNNIYNYIHIYINNYKYIYIIYNYIYIIYIYIYLYIQAENGGLYIVHHTGPPHNRLGTMT